MNHVFSEAAFKAKLKAMPPPSFVNDCPPDLIFNSRRAAKDVAQARAGRNPDLGYNLLGSARELPDTYRGGIPRDSREAAGDRSRGRRRRGSMKAVSVRILTGEEFEAILTWEG
jgi:hypothetical protein